MRGVCIVHHLVSRVPHSAASIASSTPTDDDTLSSSGSQSWLATMTRRPYPECVDTFAYVWITYRPRCTRLLLEQSSSPHGSRLSHHRPRSNRPVFSQPDDTCVIRTIAPKPASRTSRYERCCQWCHALSSPQSDCEIDSSDRTVDAGSTCFTAESSTV